MNVHLHPNLAAYWLLIIILKLALTGVVWSRQWRGRVYFFSIFVAATAMRSTILFVCSWLGWAWAYTYVYWIGSGLLHGLALAVAYECFRKLFYPYRRLPKSFMVALIGVTAGIVSVVMLLAVLFPAAVDLAELSADLYTIDRTLAVLICGLFWLLSIASDWLRLPWHRRTYGICVGFLFSYSIDLFIATMRTVLHWQISTALWPVGFTMDLICIAVWLFYFIRRRAQVEPIDDMRLREVQSFLQHFEPTRTVPPRESQRAEA